MPKDNCKKCGKSEDFLPLGLCTTCFSEKYKCKICGAPLYDQILDIISWENGNPTHTEAITFTCGMCRGVGRELSRKFR